MLKSIKKENVKSDKRIVVRINYEKKGADEDRAEQNKRLSAITLSKDAEHEEENATDKISKEK